jgi:hypothetical protein
MYLVINHYIGTCQVIISHDDLVPSSSSSLHNFIGMNVVDCMGLKSRLSICQLNNFHYVSLVYEEYNNV